MESKLEAYRLKKRREVLTNKMKESKSDVPLLSDPLVDNISEPSQIEGLQDLDDMESITSEGSIESPCSEVSVITKVIYLLYFLSWATLYVIALHYEFGAVYFIITALIFIWQNTRTSPKKKGEVSAYSVFNPNCAAIQGSINVEQLEREMGLGVPRVH